MGEFVDSILRLGRRKIFESFAPDCLTEIVIKYDDGTWKFGSLVYGETLWQSLGAILDKRFPDAMENILTHHKFPKHLEDELIGIYKRHLERENKREKSIEDKKKEIKRRLK